MIDRVDPDDISVRIWLEDRESEPADDVTSDELFDVYEADGHLVVFDAVHGHRPAASWFGVCSCGETS